MLLGTVEKIGDALVGKTDLKVGDKIATLVSLSLTPLRIDKIKEIRPDVDQVDIMARRSCSKAASTPKYLPTCPKSW